MEPLLIYNGSLLLAAVLFASFRPQQAQIPNRSGIFFPQRLNMKSVFPVKPNGIFIRFSLQQTAFKGIHSIGDKN